MESDEQWFRSVRAEGVRSALADSTPDYSALRSWRSKAVEPRSSDSYEDSDLIIEDALAFLDVRYGQRGAASARLAAAEALRRRLETAMFTVDRATQGKLLTEALPFVLVKPLDKVALQLLEREAKKMPVAAAEALAKLPEAAFATLPRDVRLGACAAWPPKLEATLAPLLERWASRVAPALRAALAAGTRRSSAARRALDPSLYASLTDLAAFDERLLEKAVETVCKGSDVIWTCLLVDLLLAASLRPRSGLGRARRVAAVLDGVEKWDDNDLAKLRTALVTTRPPLEAALKAVVDADPNGAFAKPVTEKLAPGYSKIITRPMDLSVIKTKLPSYSSLTAMEADVKLMVDNCDAFNGRNSAYSAQAHKMMRAFQAVKQASSADAEPLSARVTTRLLAEPFARALAISALATDLDAALKSRQLPYERRTSRDLVRYLSLGSKGDPIVDLRTTLPTVGSALWTHHRQAAKRKKHKANAGGGLLAVLAPTTEEGPSSDQKEDDPLVALEEQGDNLANHLAAQLLGVRQGATT